MKPHIKVIQRNGVDIFVTSSMTMKATKAEQASNRNAYNLLNGHDSYGFATHEYIPPPRFITSFVYE